MTDVTEAPGADDLKIAFLESELEKALDDNRNLRAVKVDHFRNAMRLASENQGLRIAFWNFMRRAGVHQDRAITIIRDAAQGAGTPQPQEDEGR